MFTLLEHVQHMGEAHAATRRLGRISRETLMAAASIYQREFLEPQLQFFSLTYGNRGADTHEDYLLFGVFAGALVFCSCRAVRERGGGRDRRVHAAAHLPDRVEPSAHAAAAAPAGLCNTFPEGRAAKEVVTFCP